ncbi:MAG: TolC family protein, partial [Muribaculaceae bacterium]|nr:TolC family protein [Muribaculaceae bacterium]
MKKIIISLLLAIPFTVSAQTEQFNRILNQVIDSISNIRSLESGFEAEIIALKAENSLSGPEISVEHKWPQRAGEGNRWGIEVSQEIEWPGVYSARRKAAANLADIKSFASAQTESWLRFEVADRLLQLIDVRKRLAILNEIRSNLEGVCTSMTSMLEKGHATVIDVRKAEFELLSVKEKIADTGMEYDRIATLIGFGQVMPSGLDQLTDYPDTPAELPMMTPDEIEKQVALQRSFDEERMERMKNMPTLSIGYVHDFEEGIHFNGFSIGLKLPSYSTRKRNAAKQLESETRQMKLEQARSERLASLTADVSELNRLSKLLEEYEKMLDPNDYLRQLRKSFDARQITLTQYLIDQNQYLTTQLDYLALQLRYQRLLPARDAV